MNPQQQAIPDSPEFGKALMTHKTNMKAVSIGFLIAAAVMFVATVGLLNELLAKPGDQNYAPAIGAALLGAALLAGAVWASRKGERRTTFYERGVVDVAKSGRRSVAYDDVVALRYLMAADARGRRELSIVLRLRPSSTEGTQPEPFQWTSMSGDWEAGAKVLDHLQPIVAARMQQALADGRAVPWTDALVLTPRGVRLNSSGDELAWDQIEDARFNSGSGHMELFAGGRRVARVLHHDWDAWPGLLVVRQHLGSRHASG